jgi:metal-responsive CopG/Arc/MetJ family transcriptional regulator
MIEAIDGMRRDENDLPNRQEMIRRILQSAIEQYSSGKKS